MANLINEAKRMQQLAGILNESLLNEVEVPAWLIQDVLKNKHIEGKSDRGNVEVKVGTKNVLPKKTYTSMQEIREKIGEVVKIEGDKATVKNMKGEENQYPISSLILVSGLNESEELNEMLPKDIKIGELYIASMPTSNDGEERVDVKVKVVGPAKELSDTHFVVEPIESKRFINPVSKGENEFSKGKQYNVEAMYLKPATQAESLDIEEVVNEALKAVRK